jgi:hypothetical protein
MIYVDKLDVTESDFLSLLDKTRSGCLAELTGVDVKSISPIDFEKMVLKQAEISAEGTGFKGHIKPAGSNSFPDILAKGYFGVEVKITISDKWTTIGNSVLESNRDKDVQRIYIFFGKLGGSPDIKFRTYQECLCDVGVTHSPRYKIDMKLGQGESIFEKMDTTYDKLRQSDDPIGSIKEFYRARLREGEALWWIDARSENIPVPVLRSLHKLTDDEKDKIIVEAMILFPEIFGGRFRDKFERATVYFISSKNVYSSHFRDLFSGYGQKFISVHKKKVKVQKILFHLNRLSKEIKKSLNTFDEQKLIAYWGVEKINDNRLDQWKELLNKKSKTKIESISASEIFEAGLDVKD